MNRLHFDLVRLVQRLSYNTSIVTLTLALSALSFGQEITPLIGTDGSTLNQQFLTTREWPATKSPVKDVAVLPGDVVISQFVDGGSWQTAITVVNLENHSTTFDVLFFNDNGTDLYVPVAGVGASRGVHITLGIAGSMTFQTTGTNATLATGWALLSKTTNDSIGIMAIFRQNVPGQSQEAVVPAVNQFETHFVLPFDNTGPYITGIALANPTLNNVAVTANIRNEQGFIIDSLHSSLGPYTHTSFAMPSTWPSSAGIRGAVEFMTSGVGVGALGLRFNGVAFTSIGVLANLNWGLQ
jgi:hypothetical protein